MSRMRPRILRLRASYARLQRAADVVEDGGDTRTKNQQRGDAGEQPAGGATVENDTWVDEVTGKRQLLDYLRAPSRAQLERTLEAAAVAGWRPPPGAWIGLEEVAWHHRGESEILWRTYLLSAEAVIDDCFD